MASQQALQDQLLRNGAAYPQRDVLCPVVQKRLSLSPYLSAGKRISHLPAPVCAERRVDEWEILLDANKRAAHSEFYTLGGMSISPDNAIMALARITSPAASTVCVSAILKRETGIPKCWIMSPRFRLG
ncbi:hypothetical protein ACVXG7_20605 [Enterobacter hormaechei]